MSNENMEISLEAPDSPVVETPPTPPATILQDEKRFEYQPLDELGRAVGGKQVIKYRTAEELGEKMAEQNKLLILKLRSETRKNRLGILDNEEIPAEAQRYQEPVDFSPRQLTPDERVKLSRDLLDPEQFESATDLLFESAVGVKPEKLRTVLSNLQIKDLKATAREESNAFMAATPQYVKCQENFEAITNWMIRYDLAPVRENFQKAYEKLKADGVLIQDYADLQPEPEVIVAPVAPVAPEPTVTPAEAAVPETVLQETPTVEEAKVQPARIPTGLSRSSSDDSGATRSTGDDIVYEVVIGAEKRRYTGIAAINAMPADEFKRRVNTERGFSQKVEKLEVESAERKRTARR